MLSEACEDLVSDEIDSGKLLAETENTLIAMDTVNEVDGVFIRITLEFCKQSWGTRDPVRFIY